MRNRVRDFLETKWPECAICGHTVQNLERIQDYKTMDVIFKVCCHGQTELFSLPYILLADENNRITMGKAFQDRTLPQSTKIKQLNEGVNKKEEKS